MTGVSTHVLDTARGRPAGQVGVTLDVWAGGGWSRIGASVTDADGRVRDLPAPDLARPTPCRLTFAVRGYLDTHHGGAFFPEVTVVFVAQPGQHYHVPLLLTPFGYSVYRGS
jgi:5-hydroxyisourate hydrolase